MTDHLNGKARSAHQCKLSVVVAWGVCEHPDKPDHEVGHPGQILMKTDEDGVNYEDFTYESCRHIYTVPSLIDEILL